MPRSAERWNSSPDFWAPNVPAKASEASQGHEMDVWELAEKIWDVWNWARVFLPSFPGFALFEVLVL